LIFLNLARCGRLDNRFQPHRVITKEGDMKMQHPEWTWLDAHQGTELKELDRVRGLTGYLHRIALLEQKVRTLRRRLPAGPAPQREGPAQWNEPHH